MNDIKRTSCQPDSYIYGPFIAIAPAHSQGNQFENATAGALGVSYGGGYFAWLGAKLAQQSWNVKAALFDSPWASGTLSNRQFCAAITQSNPFHTNAVENKQRLYDFTNNCYQKITSSAGITAEEAFKCDRQICEKAGLNLGPWGIEIMEAEAFG
jgi:hypothetical protein